MKPYEIRKLQLICKEIRKKVLNLALEYKDGHIAPAYSIIEILVSLYEKIMTSEDRFILSKGHACLGYYCILREKGFNPKISGHPDIEIDQGIDCTTGSLGHGLPIGVGMAFAKKYLNKTGHVFVLIGDGECQEGTTWESLNLAKKFKLDNLTIIIDHNKLQALSNIKEIMGEDNLVDKFKVFGCNVFEIDGHNLKELSDSLCMEKIKTDFPRAVIAHTTKGKGLSYMENIPKWHACLPDKNLIEKSFEELEKCVENLEK